MGCGGQDELAGKSGIASDEKKGRVVSCGPFPIPYIRSASRLKLFSVLFSFRREPHFELTTAFLGMLCDSGS